MLRAAKQSVIMVLSLVTTLSNIFSWSLYKKSIKDNCKVEFTQSDTLYLGENNVRVVCEKNVKNSSV